MNATTENMQNLVGNNESDALSVDDIKRAYYAPSDVEAINKAVEQAQEAANNDGLPVSFNFDPEQELPEGYGIATVPITQRSKSSSGNVPIGIYIAAIPDPETVANSGVSGAAWIREAAINSLVAKFANAVRPRGEQQGLPETAPFTINDFITSASRDQGLGFFREIAPSWTKALKKLGLRIMNQTLLRQVLQSRTFAEQQFPNISQEKWETILDRMNQAAEQQGKDAGVIKEWRRNRDNTEISVQDFDLDDLDEMM